VHVNLGDALLATGDRAAVPVEYSRAIELDQTLENAYVGGINVLRQTGRGAEALKSALKAINRLPRSLLIRIALVELYQATGNTNAVVDNYNKAISEAEIRMGGNSSGELPGHAKILTSKVPTS
jgi:hypothetical protein